MQSSTMVETQMLDGYRLLLSPGPACYETRVNSCVRSPEKQTSFTTAPRFGARRRPTVNPEAPLYDTRPSTFILRRNQPKVSIPISKRDI